MRFHLQSAERLLASTEGVAKALKLQSCKVFDQLKQILPLLLARRRWGLQRLNLGEFGFALAEKPRPNQTTQGHGWAVLHKNPRDMLHEVLSLIGDYHTHEQLSLRHAWFLANQPPGLGQILQSHAQRLRQDAWFLHSAYSRAYRSTQSESSKSDGG